MGKILLFLSLCLFDNSASADFNDYYVCGNKQVNVRLDQIKELGCEKTFVRFLSLDELKRYLEIGMADRYLETEIQFLKEVRRKGFSSPEHYFLYLRLINVDLKDRWEKK